MANQEEKGLLLTEESLIRILKAVNAPNYLEQKKIDAEQEAEKRKTLIMVELGKVEEENMERKKNGCSHSRHPMSAGKLGGHACKKGTGEWTTGGQFSGEEPGTGIPYALLVCTRCSWTWKWKPTPQERHFLEENGFMGYEPPAEDRLLREELAEEVA